MNRKEKAPCRGDLRITKKYIFYPMTVNGVTLLWEWGYIYQVFDFGKWVNKEFIDIEVINSKLSEIQISELSKTKILYLETQFRNEFLTEVN